MYGRHNLLSHCDLPTDYFNLSQAKGKPFALPALNEYQVFLSSKEHIREVDESSQDHLSLHAAMEDVSNGCPKYVENW